MAKTILHVGGCSETIKVVGKERSKMIIEIVAQGHHIAVRPPRSRHRVASMALHARLWMRFVGVRHLSITSRRFTPGPLHLGRRRGMSSAHSLAYLQLMETGLRSRGNDVAEANC